MCMINGILNTFELSRIIEYKQVFQYKPQSSYDNSLLKPYSHYTCFMIIH